MVIIERNAVRAIVLTPEPKVLLMRIRAPEGGDWFWITPGGGLEAGETEEAGLRRELKEELGLERFEVGPLVWRRQHTFNWGGRADLPARAVSNRPRGRVRTAHVGRGGGAGAGPVSLVARRRTGEGARAADAANRSRISLRGTSRTVRPRT